MTIVGEPKNLREAIQSSNESELELARQDMYESLIANCTWELTPLPKGHNAMKCKVKVLYE